MALLRELSESSILWQRSGSNLFRMATSLQDRIAEWAASVRNQFNGMSPGPERDELIKNLRQAETAMHLENWVNSPGLQPPR